MLTPATPALLIEVAPRRALPWGQIAPLLLLAAAPALVTVARGGTDLSGAVAAWTVVSSSVVAFAFDEPAKGVLDAAPTTRLFRMSSRLVLIFAAISVAMLVTGGIAATRGALVLDDLADRLTEAVAVGSLSLSAAGFATRRGDGRVTIGEAAFGPGVVLFITGLAQRYPSLPAVGSADNAGRWWLVTGCALLVLYRSVRDPYR